MKEGFIEDTEMGVPEECNPEELSISEQFDICGKKMEDPVNTDNPPLIIDEEDKKIGRPEKISQEIIDKICLMVRGGNYLETSAAFVGIHKDTLYDWLKKAESRGGLYQIFSDSVKKALAEGEAKDVLIIAEAAKTQWQAAAWRLERRFYERWGRKDNMNLRVSGNIEVTKEVAQEIKDIFDEEIDLKKHEQGIS